VSCSSLCVEQHLHAHAHAHQRLVRCGVQHGVLQAGVAQLAHAVAHRALAGQHHALGGQHLVGRLVTMTSTPVPAATCITACDTERRLPMP
jgi:hypothetical protein